MEQTHLSSTMNLNWFNPLNKEIYGSLFEEFIKFYEDKPVLKVDEHYDEKNPRIEIVNN